MTTTPRNYLAAGLALISIGVAPMAWAQAFPTKPVHIVVPYAAGGALDVITRSIADELKLKWGQPVIVENKLGASGNIGTEFVARAAPDGYTLLANPPPPLAINQFLFKSMPFKPSDFKIVTVLASAPNILVARPGLAVANLRELLALAKAKPGGLSYASSGIGGTPHLTMEWMKTATNTELVHVPFSGGIGPALNDVVAGHVDLMWVNISDAARHVEAGKLKALSVASLEPFAGLPGVEPANRTIPGLLSATWWTFATPAGTPDAIASRIAADVSSALKAPVISERLRALSLTPSGNSPKEAMDYVEADRQRWKAVIEKIGLKPE